MRPITILFCAVAIVACAKSDNAAADSAAAAAAATPAPPPPPPPIKLSDVAGKWNVTGKNEAGDTTLITYVFTATADTTGWWIQFKDRPKPVKVRVASVAGDSIVVDAGPYPSVLRKGVTVRTHGTLRLQNGMLVGFNRASYNVKTADSVRRVITTGTRAP